MREYVCIVGLDPQESDEIRDLIDQFAIAHVIVPKIRVQDGTLWVETGKGIQMVPVSKLIYHGIYENDLNFITGLAIWGGDCLPNPRAMMDCRLKLPCLVRALEHTKFGSSQRGYVDAQAHYETETERVAKWGNWHCGENKERFIGSWQSTEPSIIEHFLEGQAVRVAIIGNEAWQIKLDGDDWLKSIHHADAEFMDIDPELLEDTQNLKAAFGLEIIANDYIVVNDGSRHLLEVNHIPNVTRFPEIWEAYRDYVVDWINS